MVQTPSALMLSRFLEEISDAHHKRVM